MSNKTFVELYKAGEVNVDDIDNFVDEWHNTNNGNQPLHRYLGMTWRQYVKWVLYKLTLDEIVDENF